MDKRELLANLLRDGMEDYCADHDGDMTDYFVDGSIYGEDGEGNWIVGYGVIGAANLLIGRDCAICGGYKSREFSPTLKKGLETFRALLENC